MISPEPQPESANARVCRVCGITYTDDTSHVATDAHLEAMADDTVHAWAAMAANSTESIDIARQIARLEVFWDDYRGWCAAMRLDAASDEALLINRRVSWVWIKAVGMADYETRMEPGRHRVDVELHGLPDMNKTLKKIEQALK